jgi:hypothetical protein
MDNAVHPPLYYVLLRFWIVAFGNSPAATRALSAVFSVASIGVFFDMCRLLHGAKSALLCAALLAVSIGQIEVARETRNYAQMIFFALASADALLRIEYLGTSRARITALSLLLAATALSHYYSVGAILAMGIYALIRLRRKQLRWTLAAFAIGGAIVLITWGPFIRDSLPKTMPSFLHEIAPAQHLENSFARVAILPAKLLLGRIYARSLSKFVLGGIDIFLIVIPIVRIVLGNRALVFWVLWIFGTIGFVFATDLINGTQALETVRYTVPAASAFCAIIGAFCWPPKPIWRNVLAIGVLCYLLLIVRDRISQDGQAWSDWPPLAQYVSQNIPPNDAMIYYDLDPWLPPGLYYMCLQYYSPDFNHPWMLLNRPAGPHELTQLAGRKEVWLIGRNAGNDAAMIMPGWRVEGLPVWSSAGIICKLVRDVPN